MKRKIIFIEFSVMSNRFLYQIKDILAFFGLILTVSLNNEGKNDIIPYKHT
jgi:hypothetical protein